MKVVFLDRDGVINIDHGYVHDIDNFQFVDGIFDTCLWFRKNDYHLVICTNQSGIGRGLYSEAQFKSLNTWMVSKFLDHGIPILDVYYCPHLPHENCKCRKPSPGMLIAAHTKYNIKLELSHMIGDSESDILAGRSAGVRSTILLRQEESSFTESTKADYVVKNIKECYRYVK